MSELPLYMYRRDCGLITSGLFDTTPCTPLCGAVPSTRCTLVGPWSRPVHILEGGGLHAQGYLAHYKIAPHRTQQYGYIGSYVALRVGAFSYDVGTIVALVARRPNPSSEFMCTGVPRS